MSSNICRGRRDEPAHGGAVADDAAESGRSQYCNVQWLGSASPQGPHVVGECRRGVVSVMPDGNSKAVSVMVDQ